MYIPHNFGRSKMSNFIINNEQVLEKKSSLVSDLIDIHKAVNIQKNRSRAISPLTLKKKSSSVASQKL
jgi:hypothetical protein